MKTIERFLLKACLLLVASLIYIGGWTILNLPAQAVSLNHNSLILAVEPAEVVDNIFGEGTADKIQGKTQKDIGTVERNVDQITDQAEGALKQAQGKAQKDIGTVERNVGKMTDQADTTLQGTLKQAQGKAQQDIGTVERNVSKVTGQAEGALKQAQGKAQQDIGEVKGRVDQASSEVEDASGNLIDAFQDLFN